MQETDPLAVIAEDAPKFSDKAAVDIVRANYGLEVSVRTLISERDQNFRLTATDGQEYVLKIANSAEAPEVTDFQIQALLHIAERRQELDLPVNVPGILRTIDGATSIELASDGGTHVGRIVTFLEGAPLAGHVPSPMLAHNLGTCLAHLGRALQSFSHPGSRQSLLWDLQQALNLRQLIPYVAESGMAEAVADALDDFEQHAAGSLSGMRSQVIHSDLNPDNVLIDPADSDAVVGVIDFGDMLDAPLIADVAIACSYLRVPRGNPLGLIAEFIAGYHEVTPLLHEEIDILHELVQARLSASISILDWRATMRGGDYPYLAGHSHGEGSAGHFLIRLREIPRDNARQVFRQVCASANGQALS